MSVAEFVQHEPTGRIDVMIGAHTVATIRPNGKHTRYGFSLPGIDGARITDSVEKARRLVLHVIADWFRSSGPTFAATVALLDRQAESERSLVE